MTNSLPVANLFAASERTDVVFLGGQVHHRTGITLGPHAVQMLKGIRVQKSILSVAGIDRRGYYNSNLLLVETERAMMQCADQTIVVADSGKFGRSSLVQLCDLDQIQRIVVDDELSEEWQGELRQAGVAVSLAQSETSQATSTAQAIPAPHWNSVVARENLKT